MYLFYTENIQLNPHILLVFTIPYFPLDHFSGIILYSPKVHLEFIQWRHEKEELVISPSPTHDSSPWSNVDITCNSITNSPIWHPCVNPSDRGPEIAIFFFWVKSKDISSNKNNYCIVVICYCQWEMISKSKELFYLVSLLPHSKALEWCFA